ncbi:MAG: Phosphoglycerate mutase [Frankiales bacterium]|nr:Phosphoglycerate mutase [Frankiales bacterium]
MEIVLVRHALPVRIDATHDGGPADPGLADAGKRQAERVLQALAGDEVTALYTSPAARARQTAAPLEQALGLAAQVEPGIAEFDAGDCSYVPVEELKAAGDPRWKALMTGDLYSAGVDPVEFRARVVEAVERIVERHPGGRAVLFTHAGTINAYAGHVLGQVKTIWFPPAYCSVNRIGAARDGRRGVNSLNETAHVRDLLRG